MEVDNVTYEKIFKAISLREKSANSNTGGPDENIKSRIGSIFIPEGVEVKEMDSFLHIKGTSGDLQRIADQIQAMEFLSPGIHHRFAEWKFLVTDGAVMSSKEEKFIALPPDEWLIMGCKFNDAISGFDYNPYRFFNSLFGNHKLPYGIEILVTDLTHE